MKKFSLTIGNKVGGDIIPSWTQPLSFDQIMSFKRKYQSMNAISSLDNNSKHIGMFMQISSKHCSQIRFFELNSFEFEDPNDFRNLLINMPFLEELVIVMCTLKRPLNLEQSSCVQILTLNRLKMLSIYFHCSLLQLFNGPNIKTLKLLASKTSMTLKNYFIFSNNYEGPQSLIRFLENCVKLETIETNSSSQAFSLELVGNFPFKLKTFKMEDSEKFTQSCASRYNILGLTSSSMSPLSIEIKRNIAKFLVTQSSSLEELEVNVYNQDMFRTIWSLLPNLRVLRFKQFHFVPSDDELRSSVNNLKNLKKIFFLEFPVHSNCFKFLQHCPNLESLSLITDQRNFFNLSKICHYNPKLKELSLESLSLSAAANFPCLEFLHVERFTNIGLLLSFLKINPNVDTLSIRIFNDGNRAEDVLALLLNVTHLRHLKFVGSFDGMKEIYDILKVNFKSIKSLELEIQKAGSTPRKVLIEFPDDPSQWDSKKSVF